MARKLKEKMYNEQIKERFLNESGWGEEFINHARVIFKNSSRLENSLQKDIYDFTAQETADLLHFLQLKSKGHVMQAVSAFAKYLTWAYQENLTANPINYFSSLYSSDNASDFVSSVARETRLITEDQLKQYEDQLTAIDDYVDAAMLRACFLGLRGTNFKDLLELTIDRIKPGAIVLDNRTIPITDYEYNLLVSAYNQPEMVSLKGENASRVRPVYYNCPYIFKAILKYEPLKYYTFAGKMLAIGEYVGRSGLTTTNLYFSGMVAALKKMMADDKTDPETVFNERSLTYFDKLKEQFGFEGEPRYLKYKLQDYFYTR